MRTIVIDAGHGGSTFAGNSSPYGVRGPRGAIEKDVMLALAHRVAAHYGAGSILTRTSDINLPLAERTAIAQRHGSAVFISLHANAGPSGARGAEAYVHERSAGRSLALADSIQRELGAYGHAIAHVDRAPLAVLSPEKLPSHTAACLLEVDYLSDPHGEQRLTDPASLDRLGAAIARGVRRYMGSSAAVAEGLDGGATIIIGVVGLVIGAFSLINAVEQRNVGGLTWSRNITKVTHTYPNGVRPHEWRDCMEVLLNVDCTSGFSSARAVFVVHWRANGNDIDQCRVEKLNSSDWDSSLLRVSFEGVDASSYEANSVGCIMMHISGHLDPAGTGDIDFDMRTLIKADGTMVNQPGLIAGQGINVSRGDRSAFDLTAGGSGTGWLMTKR